MSKSGIYIFWPFAPPPWEGEFLSKLKNREGFEGGKRGEKKKKRVIKHTLKFLYES